MYHFQGKVRFLAGLLLAGMVMAATETGFPAKAQSDDWTHAETGRLPLRAVDKPEVTWMPSPNFDARPEGAVIDMIVIHDTETPGVRDCRTISRHFASPKSRVSAHYIIGKDGEIAQCVPDDLRAWHTGESYFMGEDHLNDRSIGIELVNGQTGDDPFTNAQYRSLIRLVSYLVNAYDVPMERIVGHKDITLKPEVKKDPATNFSWSRLLGGVKTTLAVASVREAELHR
ncbi:MAG TPA: N-acetylmuramoyl-L-alanine amidase [Stenomitos sp.]